MPASLGGTTSEKAWQGVVMGNRSMRSLLQVSSDVDLAKIDPGSVPGLPSDKAVKQDAKGWSRSAVAEIGLTLAVEQEKLIAGGKIAGDRRRILVVLQAMDCGGKDGTVRHVIGQLNPLGLQITSFGVPTPEERAHHFLWRIRSALPKPGYIGVFNRSHYEDVLVARVHNLVPEEVWRHRYEEINDFERELADDGVTIAKIMLHISPEEQRQRLVARLKDPTKRWKFNPGDIDERAKWRDYQEAYRDALAACSTGVAPWFVVPADRKWYRDFAVARLLQETFESLKLRYPDPDYDVDAQLARLSKSSGRNPDSRAARRR
jgi:PPK2 family polyphosphate:nucleotide phosphotransferase